MKIAVVIPAYNEAPRIEPVLRGLPRTIKGHEVVAVVVDDGSRDATSKEARKVETVHVVRHGTNLGKGGAAKTGCDAAVKLKADIIVLIDADGQHKASDIPRMIQPLLDSESQQLVIGARIEAKGAPLVRRLGNHVLRGLGFILFRIRTSDSISGFRAFRTSSYSVLRWAATNYEMEVEMSIRAALAGIPFTEVPIETIYLDGHKGMTVQDGLKIINTMLKWALPWYREYRLSH
jgi:glycosyltransferase involved in cell wall biosynthesis